VEQAELRTTNKAATTDVATVVCIALFATGPPFARSLVVD
jgi:hypothetical protein